MANDQEPTEQRALRAANLFDIRRIMGGLFLVYGITLVVLGAGASEEDLRRAHGVNVNLSVGIVLIAMAAFFIGWALLRPLSQELAKQPERASGRRFVTEGSTSQEREGSTRAG